MIDRRSPLKTHREVCFPPRPVLNALTSCTMYSTQYCMYPVIMSVIRKSDDD